MRRLTGLLLLFCTLHLTVATAANLPAAADFRYFSELKGPLQANVLYEVHLTSDILAKCAGDCRDLRLLDQDNREIPYVILDNKLPEGIETTVLELLEFREEKNFALVTAKLAENALPLTQIEIETPERDFQKNIEILGSRDLKVWSPVTKDTIYDFSAQVDLRKTVVKFKKANYRFFRLKLEDAGPAPASESNLTLQSDGINFSTVNQKKLKLRINRIVGRSDGGGDRATVRDEKILINPVAKEDQDRNSILTLAAGVPVEKLYFEVSNPFFYRNVEVWGGDQENGGFKDSLVRDSIYSFSLAGVKETKDYVECNAGPWKNLRLVVTNKNNPPLEMKNIRLVWIRKNLYFFPLQDAAGCRLYFGSDLAKKPEYDLGNFIHQDNWFKNKYEKLAETPVKQNPDFRSKLVSNKAQLEKYGLIVVVIGLVIGVGIWLVMLMKAANGPKVDRNSG